MLQKGEIREVHQTGIPTDGGKTSLDTVRSSEMDTYEKGESLGETCK